MKNKLLNEIRHIFSDVLGENIAKDITLDSSANDVDSWDSFAHISIVVGVEEKYDISFTTSELGKLTNVNDFIDLLIAKVSS